MTEKIYELTTDECIELLSQGTVGRLAMATPAGLRIYPVNYAMFGDMVVFRTIPYGELANYAGDAEVAFETDHIDYEAKKGWNVLAVGRCQRVTDPGEVQLIRSIWDPEPWAEGQRNLYMKVEWRDLTGRTIGEESAFWATKKVSQAG